MQELKEGQAHVGHEVDTGLPSDVETESTSRRSLKRTSCKRRRLAKGRSVFGNKRETRTRASRVGLPPAVEYETIYLVRPPRTRKSAETLHSVQEMRLGTVGEGLHLHSPWIAPKWRGEG